jgi:hypothetical protein
MNNQFTYQKLNVPDLELIQNEALEYIKTHRPELLGDDVVTDEYFILSIEDFPILKSFLDPRVITHIEEIGLVCVPPKTEMVIHLDGIRKDPDRKFFNQLKETIINHPDSKSLNLKEELDKLPTPLCVQFAMMVPILNYENTINYWYNNDDVSDDSEVVWKADRNTYPYSFFLTYLKPNILLNPIDSTNINCITFIKTDIFHNVYNRGSKTRMAFTIKFAYQNYASLEEMFRYRDLL